MLYPCQECGEEATRYGPIAGQKYDEGSGSSHMTFVNLLISGLVQSEMNCRF